MSTPLQRYIEDHKFILDAISKAANIADPVAVDLDEFCNPLISKSKSPTSPLSVRLMPTSIIVAPGFSQSPLTISGRPTAATTISAPRTTSGRSLVRLWATVTVQLAPISNSAIGLPTMFDRPITTALLPLRSPSSAWSNLRQPSGVQGDGEIVSAYVENGKPVQYGERLFAIRTS